MNYINAQREDLLILAAMHIEPSSRLNISSISKNKKFRFYMDKVNFFFEVEPEGIIVAKDNSSISGFIIFTKDIKNLRRSSIKKGYFKSWVVSSLKGIYGLNWTIFKKLIVASFAFLGFFSKRTSIKAWIIALIVIREYRGKGVGTELVKRSLKILEDNAVDEVGVTFLVNNSLAKRLYRRCGFKEKGFIVESTGKSIFMSKKLNIT